MATVNKMDSLYAKTNEQLN